ncbi:hypothetical protein BpHYR1_053761 [Brachionus plicatilis]|uniref:Uncharacterized protein n=1 Tax=Brachionus plicatilis TaxID=10195 RepID=A0A3M7QLW4_BRAPC|nr:hypothetical protein BpHYR1_053761 [Brachionus plicatilis]
MFHYGFVRMACAFFFGLNPIVKKLFYFIQDDSIPQLKLLLETRNCAIRKNKIFQKIYLTCHVKYKNLNEWIYNMSRPLKLH